MNLFKLIFIKIPRRIFHLCFWRIECLYYRFFYVASKLFDIPKISMRYLLGDKPSEFVVFFKSQFPDMVEEKVKEAELICEHTFDVLGSGPTKLSKEGIRYGVIDWHTDFKSGYQWNQKTFFRDIRYGNKEGVDIKVPWELSRFQHFIILGQAYLLSKDEKYVREFIDQVGDWIKHNKVGFGVNWFCAMDIAIRAVNWLVALEYFYESDQISERFLQELYSSVYEHGKFIRKHLENKPVKTNHYLADVAGLFFISVYCPFFKESKKWQKFAIKELENEIRHQVYPDGCSFEASTSYHRFSLEVFFYCELLAKRSGLSFSTNYQQRLKKMFEFSLYCIKPNGKIPQIGDNDNGRFLIFSKRSILEHRYLLHLATIYYREPRFKMPAFDFNEESLWLFGKDSRKIYDGLEICKQPIGSKAFPNAGWYIIRHKDDYCFISCGPNGQNGENGHAHNDILSFELVISGEDVIVDPGTYVYTPCPKERNKFRSTAYHNTIRFDECEQNAIPEDDVFSLSDSVRIKNVKLEESKDKSVFHGEIQYAGNIHKKEIILDKQTGKWQIKDQISCLKSTKTELIFHLSPEVYYDSGFLVSKKTKKKIAGIEIKGYEIEKEEYDYSPKYGIKEKAERISANLFYVSNVAQIQSDINRLGSR